MIDEHVSYANVQCVAEREDGKEELAPPILQLSSEKITRYGVFLMDYGLVSEKVDDSKITTCIYIHVHDDVNVNVNFVPCIPDLAQLIFSSFFQGMYIWVAKDAPQALIQKIFGVPHFGAIPEIMVCIS